MAAAEFGLRRHGERGLARAVATAYRTRLPPAELAWSERIERVRADLEARDDPLDRDGRTVGDITRAGSKQRREAGMLMALVRSDQPESVIEMGTCVGISGSYVAAALQMNGHGLLTTLERGAERVAIARKTWGELGLGDRVDARIGRFANTLAPALADRGPVDFLFIDGHHEREPTLEFYAAAIPHLRPGALVVFDDIRWSDGMREAWAEIARRTDHKFALDVGGIGIVRRR